MDVAHEKAGCGIGAAAESSAEPVHKTRSPAVQLTSPIIVCNCSSGRLGVLSTSSTAWSMQRSFLRISRTCCWSGSWPPHWMLKSAVMRVVSKSQLASTCSLHLSCFQSKRICPLSFQSDLRDLAFLLDACCRCMRKMRAVSTEMRGKSEALAATRSSDDQMCAGLPREKKMTHVRILGSQCCVFGGPGAGDRQL